MQRFFFTLIVAAGLVLGVTAKILAQTFIAGTYQQGSHVSEPNPAKSQYMKTKMGGFAVTETQAQYIVYVELTKAFDHPVHMKTEFENPLDKNHPLVEEADIKAGEQLLSLASGAVRGLRVDHSYSVKISLYQFSDRKNPIDVLKQNIKSYIDSTGPHIRIKAALAAKPQR